MTYNVQWDVKPYSTNQPGKTRLRNGLLCRVGRQILLIHCMLLLMKSVFFCIMLTYNSTKCLILWHNMTPIVLT